MRADRLAAARDRVQSTLAALPLWLRRQWYASGLLRQKRQWQQHRRCRRMLEPVRLCISEQPTLTLARVIGNDLYPRHAKGQALANLKYILEHEPDFPGWGKIFVLNRWLDLPARDEAEHRIREAGHQVKVIDFDPAEYRALQSQAEYFGGFEYFETALFKALDEYLQNRARLWACAPRVRYLMNVNGARNEALSWGRKNSDWVLVLDGSCFVSEAAFQKLCVDLTTPPFTPYLVVPMQRLKEPPTDCFPGDPDPRKQEEPQLGFRFDSKESFDCLLPYGMRDKTALLDRLGVPGPWNQWASAPWLPKTSKDSPERHCYKLASACVWRLPSGLQCSSRDHNTVQQKRYYSRLQAIFRTLAIVDEAYDVVDRHKIRAMMGVDLDDILDR
jgi:hypothetical protein